MQNIIFELKMFFLNDTLAKVCASLRVSCNLEDNSIGNYYFDHNQVIDWGWFLDSISC